MLRLFAWLPVALSFGAHAQAPTVFAAASLKNALDEAAALHGTRLVISYGASSALARQIENGAPADVFISADLDWMDYVEKKGLLAPGTRRNLLGNRLVLIAPARQPVKLQPGAGISDRGGAWEAGASRSPSRTAFRPASTPRPRSRSSACGTRSRAASPRRRTCAPRSLLVARGEAPLGVVYQTDASAEPNVMVVGVFPADSHPPIVYPVAALKAAKRRRRVVPRVSRFARVAARFSRSTASP